jgi:hypothetical protein
MANPPVKHSPGVADVVAHVPNGYDSQAAVNLVIFFHGSDQCIAQLALGGDVVCKPGTKPDVGAGVAWRHDDAGTMSLFAAPQLTLWGGGTAGRFAERGYFGSFVEELLRDTFAPGVGGPKTLDDVATITLIGHSAGFVPVLEILRGGEWDDKVQNVVLLDALFAGGADVLSAWIERGLAAGRPRKLVAVYGAWGDNVANARAIANRIEHRMPHSTVVDPTGGLADAARTHVVTVKLWRRVEHSWMLLLLMGKTVAGLGLPLRAMSPLALPAPGVVRDPLPISIGETQRGTIDAGDLRLQNGALADEYSLDLAHGQRVTIEARGGRSSTEPCCLLDVVMQVLQGDRVVACDDDSAGEFDARLDLTPAEDGRYRIRVSTYGAGERRGPYSLRVFRSTSE